MRFGISSALLVRSAVVVVLSLGVVLGLVVGTGQTAPTAGYAAASNGNGNSTDSNGNSSSGNGNSSSGNGNSSSGNGNSSSGNGNSSDCSSANGNGNSSSGNGNSSSGNGNSSDCSSANGNGNESGAAAVTPSATVSSSNTSFNSADGVVTVAWTSGGAVEVVSGSAGSLPAAPSGLHVLRSTGLQMIPQSTPNGINLVVHFSDADRSAQGTPGGALRMFYWAQALGRWVEMPSSTDMGGHNVTSSNVDVSAFINQTTPLALMG